MDMKCYIVSECVDESYERIISLLLFTHRLVAIFVF